MSQKINKSFTLIEVLIFVSILSLFFVVAAAVMTASLRNTQISQHRIMATRYAEELVEWLRSRKEYDWYGDFILHAGGGTYCFNYPIDFSGFSSYWPTSTGACSSASTLSPDIFQREARLTKNAQNTQVAIDVTVTWDEVGNTYTVPIKTTFSLFE